MILKRIPFQRRPGAKFPTPDTVDILAEVSEYRTGKDLGRSRWTVSDFAEDAIVFSDDERDFLVRVAAEAVARIELIDRGEVE